MTNKPKPFQDDTEAGSALAIELKQAKERQKKLEYALHKSFPIELYKQARPEVEADCHGIRERIIEHFLEHDIDEIDFKEEGQKRKIGLYEHLKKASSLLAIELQKSKERGKSLDSALQEIFPIDLYKHLRPDIKAVTNGDSREVIEHFVAHDINTIDIKKEHFKYANTAALQTAESCLRNLNLEDPSEEIPKEDKRSLALLKTKGNISNLKANKDHDFAIKHTSIHYKSNSVCTWIPKNGCSNIRYSIAKENGTIAGVEEIEWIHRNNDCFNTSTKEALQADYTFIILRNPFKRLLSFFLDKLCHSQKDQSEESYQRAHKAFNFNGDLNYSDFIDYIWENTDSIYNDEHARPQCDFLLYRSYDNYFALEEIKKANQEIFEKTGINLEDIRDKNSIFTSKGCERTQEITHMTKANEISQLLNQNKIPIPENMYTNEMIKKVSTLYLQDILLYCSKIKDGRSEMDYWIQKAIMNQ